MRVVITIDAEEDNWGDYHSKRITVDNIARISSIQKLFNEYNVIPTYLVTYPVATDKNAVSLLRGILEEKRCEIGTHCHPWNTPPFEEDISEKSVMLSNLPYALQLKKIQHLHDTISHAFNITPVCFRAGRWGYNNDTAEALITLGYKVDTSVTAFTDWSQYYGPDFTDFTAKPFWQKAKQSGSIHEDKTILEVPATVGYKQKHYLFCNKTLKLAKKRPFNYLKLCALLGRMKLINKIMLSPEMSSGASMIKLCRGMQKNNYPFLNMFFHSTSLMAGLSPFVKSKADEDLFRARIRDVLAFCKNERIESIPLSGAVHLL
jgi:hypothetical protein